MPDTPAFYDGQTDYIPKLNQLYTAFSGGPYNSLPLAGGTLTGPLTLNVPLALASGGTGSNTAAGARDALALPTTAGAGYIGTPVGSVQDVLTSLGDSSNGIPGVIDAGATVVVLGDSLGEGVGATYTTGWAYRAARSLLNKTAGGYGYPTTINMRNAITEPGITTTGALSETGVVTSRLVLAPGQYIRVTGRMVAYVDAMYDASASSGGSLAFYVNGALLTTKTMSGAGIRSTFSTAVKGGAATLLTDVVEMRAVGASVTVTGIVTILPTTPDNPLVWVAACGGFSYTDFLSTAAMDEIAAYMMFSGTGEKVILMGLGTNSMHRPERGQTPAAMITDMSNLVAGLTGRAGASGVSVAIWVPPRSTLPFVVSGQTYENYVKAVVAAGKTNSISVMDLSKTILGGTLLLASDGVHLKSKGHGAAAKTACDIMGVQLNSKLPR